MNTVVYETLMQGVSRGLLIGGGVLFLAAAAFININNSEQLLMTVLFLCAVILLSIIFIPSTTKSTANTSALVGALPSNQNSIDSVISSQTDLNQLPDPLDDGFDLPLS